MRFTSNWLITFAALLAVSAAQAQERRITSITPSRGSIHGGEDVVIAGLGFVAICPQVCHGVREVWFGGVKAEILQLTNTSIAVRTPPHPPAAAGRNESEGLSGHNPNEGIDDYDVDLPALGLVPA
ncbi:MAG TPA: IPT/TIG domain-containing protein [Thermoanaerobaculia bacterium]|nr:IPT/TIG domain-containing protein [Thermoanaerobaculia bacterium]